MRRPRTLLLLGALLALPSHASTALQLDVEGLTAAATDVVHGRVLSETSGWSGDHRRIVTRVAVAVLERWKGSAAGQVTVVRPGGHVGDLVQDVSGVAELRPGDEVVLFLARTGPYHRVVGLSQGIYLVSSGPEPQALPVSAQDLELVAPPGRTPSPRVPVALSQLRTQVKEAR